MEFQASIMAGGSSLESGDFSSKISKSKEAATVTKDNFITRSFGPFKIKLDDDLGEITDKIHKEIKEEAPLLMESFEHGYEIKVFDKELVRPTQLRKVQNVTELTVVRKPKPIEVTKTEEDEKSGEDDDEDGDDVSGSGDGDE